MVNVEKADGSIEGYKPEKLRASLQKAGATKEEQDYILKEVDTVLFEGITTEALYKEAFRLLRESELPAAARYSLRRALFGLGPTGFPFEVYLARLFEAEGYTTRTGITIEGECVSHELDVAGWNDTDSFVAEAKFHARPGIKSDLQVALYCYARKVDLLGQSICEDDRCGIKRFLVVTNTKFTTTAIKYAECADLELLSWNYPKQGNLHDRIREQGLYPITVLQSLSGSGKRALIERGAIVCRDIVKKPQLLRHAHISPRKIEAVLSEARQLCTPLKN